MENDQQLRFIGTIHSELKTLDDCPRQEKKAHPQQRQKYLMNLLKGSKTYSEVTSLFCLRGCTSR